MLTLTRYFATLSPVKMMAELWKAVLRPAIIYSYFVPGVTPDEAEWLSVFLCELCWAERDCVAHCE